MYDRIQWYAEKHWDGKSLSHVYLNILTLKRRGLEEDLAIQLKDWQEEMQFDLEWGLSNRLNSKEVQWVMARYENAESSAATLEQGLIEEAPSSYFGLLLQAISQTTP